MQWPNVGKIVSSVAHTVNNDLVKPVQRDTRPVMSFLQPQAKNDITPKHDLGAMVTPKQYRGTDTGFPHIQGTSIPGVNPNVPSPAFTGGLDIRQLNIPESIAPGPNSTLYNHPAPYWTEVTPPSFQPYAQLYGNGVSAPFSTRSIGALPPRMVNVSWSPNQVTYEQSLNPPHGF